MGGRVRTHILRELVLSVLFSSFFGIAVFGLGKWLLPELETHGDFAAAMALQIIVAIFIGTTLPLLMRKLKVDPTVATVPISTALADISAILILFGLFYAN